MGHRPSALRATGLGDGLDAFVTVRAVATDGRREGGRAGAELTAVHRASQDLGTGRRVQVELRAHRGGQLDHRDHTGPRRQLCSVLEAGLRAERERFRAARPAPGPCAHGPRLGLHSCATKGQRARAPTPPACAPECLAAYWRPRLRARTARPRETTARKKRTRRPLPVFLPFKT